MRIGRGLLTLLAVATTMSTWAELTKDAKGNYLIGSAKDLAEFTLVVRSGETGANALLTADVDMGGESNFQPIGLYSEDDDHSKFSYSGTFDGNGHVVRNLTVRQTDTYKVGLFGRTDGCTIKNLGIINATMTSEAGATAGVIAGEITNSTILNCFTAGTLTVTTEEAPNGGIAGEVSGSTTLTNCYTTHETLASSNSGSIDNSYAGDEVTNMQPGELCYTLNGDQTSIHYYQDIATDAYPTQDASRGRVYAKGDLSCNGMPVGDVTYTNSDEGITLPPHEYDEDGYCVNCGAEESPVTADKEGWYNITTAKELRYIARFVNRGNSGINIRLANDIDMEGMLTEPIGKYSDDADFPSVHFKGTFDGQGHTISNLHVVCTDHQEVGMFGRVSGGATIRNLGIINAEISSEGGIRAGVFAGEIHNCTVTNCFSAGTISITTSHDQKGGISGEAANTTLNNCYTTYETLANAPGSTNNCYWGEDVEENAPSGILCYKLNGGTFDNPTYYQNIDDDNFPVLDSTHGIVYKTGEDTYASAKDDEEFADLLGNLLANEKAEYEEKIATKALINNYLNSLDKLAGSTREEFAKAFNNMKGIRDAISQSEAAYAAYQQKIADIKAYLEANTCEGKEFDRLTDYLTKTIEPGDIFPNGSYLYITSELALSTAAIEVEAEYAQGLLDYAIKSNYQPGTDITNMMTNADFSQNFTGWTIDEGNPGISSTAGCRNIAVLQDSHLDISQTLHNLRPGLYEIHFNAYAELNGAAEESAYNYNAFLYANDSKNNLLTRYNGLLTEEEASISPNDFSLVTDINGKELGYSPDGYRGLAIALNAGHYDNSIIVAVDDSLKLGITTRGTYERNTDTFFSNARLTFLGSYDQASDALDAQIAKMVETANHMLTDYVPDMVTYGNAPNYSLVLQDELTAAVDAAQAATTGQAKYEAMCKLGDLFMDIYESKEAYLQMAILNDRVYEAFTSNSTKEEGDAYEAEVFQPIANAYANGSYSTEEAQARIESLMANEAYRKTYGVEPEQNEDGYYACEDAYNLVWVAQQVNSGKHRGIKVVLENDIDMSVIGSFTPIGLHSDNGSSHTYNGTFDGQGHVIRDLTVSCDDGSEAGFFSRTEGATIKNVGFINADITNTADIRAGVLGGEVYRSVVTNVFSAGKLVVNTTHEQAGGLCGESAESTLNNCYTTHDVLTNAGTTRNCYDGIEAEGKLTTGELCYLLNGNQKNIAYYQRLNEDSYPTLDSLRGQVYCEGALNCDGTPSGDITYTNTQGTPQVAPHDYDEDGICKNCGADRGECEADEDGWFNLKDGYALRWFSTYVNEGNTSAKARLENDIDMAGISMQPIGRYSDDHEFDGTNHTFYGEFDGQGHEIRNLDIVITERNEGGLFSRAAGGALIHNFGLVNTSIVNTHSNGCRLGTICGELNGATIRNVYIVGTLNLKTASVQCASFAGEAAQGSIVNCYTTSDMELSYLGTKTNCYRGSEVDELAPTGELCYRLNGNTSVNPAWRQTLGRDTYPVLSASSLIVYQHEDGTFDNKMNEMDTYAGTADDPIRIKSTHDMQMLRDYLKAGQVTYVTLEADIDMSGVTDWKPLNLAEDTFDGKNYMNWIQFDGKGHTITGFHCTQKDQSYNSLFGVLCGGVYNLGLVDASVDCQASGSGMLAGYVGHANYEDTTYVCNTYVTGQLHVTSNYCGGLFGNVGGATVIRNCYANLNITSGAQYVGGLLGRVSAALTMENCYAAGTCPGHGITGGKNSSAPASVFANIAVWNNDYEDFGPTATTDKLTGITYYNGDNFAELQQAVVAWDPTTWSVTGDEYPVLIATVTPTGVEAVTPVIPAATNAVYTLSGVRVGTSLRNLPKGIYIMNGKKIMVK